MRTDNNWIRTYTGKRFWPLDPRVEDVDIHDVAHALSQLCRFTGHTREFYSIAQHSVLVSELIEHDYGPTAGLIGLLHDGSEAYLLDLARPVKHAPELAQYREIERALQTVVYAAFDLYATEGPWLKAADMRLYYAERRDLMTPLDEAERSKFIYDAGDYPTIVPWRPETAERRFLAHFERLRREAA